MKKVRLLCTFSLCILTLCVCFTSTISAETQIPEEMPENTLIKFIDENNYVILDGEEKENNQFNKTDFNEVVAEDVSVNDTDAKIESYPSPCKDMFVQYGSDGYVNRIYTSKDIQVYANVTSEKQQPSTRGVDDPHYSLVAKWGSYPNYLYRGISNYPYLYYGRGRATTFSDTIGQQNHVLVKGDIATKLEYDNCAYNTVVYVSLPKASGGSIMTHSMKKRDAGGMPNAIVDVWKTGVEYWGYNYNSSLSIGNATIEHN